MKNVALIVGAIAVVGLCANLFVQVRAAPSPVAAAPRDPTPAAASGPILHVHDDSPAPSEPSPVAAPPPTVTATRTPTDDNRPTVHHNFRGVTATVIQNRMPGRDGSGDGSADKDPALEAMMEEANKAYDNGDLEDARDMAKKVLAQQPDNRRMLRISVSVACMGGDAAAAQEGYAKLPPGDQQQMAVRCQRYNVTLGSPSK